MSDAKTQQEPSMEEILASIRRIISDDDVLELTDRVNDDGSVASIQQGLDDFPDLDGGAKPSFSLDDREATADKDDISFDQDEFSHALMSGASSAAAASAFAQLEQEM